MKKKKKKHVQWIILVFVLGIMAAGLYFYFYHLKKDETPATVARSAFREKLPLIAEEEPPPAVEETSEEASDDQKIMEPVVADQKDPCLEVEALVKDFFLFLNNQAYIQQISPERDTFETFVRIIKKLSRDPPSPAGEGLDPRQMVKNIFYFFRVLDDTEIRIIKEITRHEAETLEMNLAVFYQWLLPVAPCPDPDNIRPSFSLVYAFSGFFTNTIGGRSYLFRRSPLLRQLVTYYALLSIHEADKRGENTHGLDILPEIRSLARAMEINPDLRLKQIYLEYLETLLVYYQDRR